MSTSTLTVAVTTVSVYMAMFTLSGDNVHYQPLLSTFNEKAKIKKYDRNTFSDMTNQTILSSRDILDIRLVRSSSWVAAQRNGWVRTGPISQMARTTTLAFIPFELFHFELWPSNYVSIVSAL